MHKSNPGPDKVTSEWMKGHRLRCSFWKRITGKEPKGVTPNLNAVTRETQYKTAQTQGGEASRPANEHRNRRQMNRQLKRVYSSVNARSAHTLDRSGCANPLAPASAVLRHSLSHAYANFTLVINLTWGDAAMSVGANKWRLQYSARNHEWRSSSSVSRGVRFGA
ncbi:hypothetical protein BJV77DRAFT_965744 [Russula vinacea]|nr:hypothetical protein BJV77DRAFT_965744 [Russula vinacea]